MERPRLDSWKEIAHYLGRDVRTVSRWERRHGLPVNRVPGGRRPRVFAYPADLDEWLARGGADEDTATLATPAQPRAHWSTWLRVAAASAIGAGVLAAALGFWRGADHSPARLAVLGNEVIAIDGSGAAIWRHRFDGEQLAPPTGRWFQLSDLDGDRQGDALATVGVAGPTGDQRGGRLLRLSSTGRREWTSTVEDTLAFRGSKYGPPWATADVSVYHSHGEPRIAWAVHHFTWWPGLLISINAHGERIGTFVNAGWITRTAASPDGRYLIVTGVTNSRAAYFVAILDAANPAGRSPEEPGSPFECVTCPPGDPLYYFVLPRTDVGAEEPFPVDGPAIQTFANGGIQVQTHESASPNFAAVVYDFTPDFTVVRASFTDAFWERHRRLEADGRIAHPANQGPEQQPLAVQRWTPAAGWDMLPVPVR